VQFVRGVGPARAREFASLGVHTVGDLIEHFPFRHELVPKSVPIGSLEEGMTATVVGELRRVRTRGSFKKQSVGARVVDGTGTCRVHWFNSPYLTDRLHDGQVVRLTGKVDVYGSLASFANPQLQVFDDDEDPFADDADRFEPVYPAIANLPSKRIAAIIGRILDETVQLVVDHVPESIRQRRKFPPRRTAVLRYHRPTSLDEVPIARRRLAYDELLLTQLAVQVSRRRLQRAPRAQAVRTTDAIDERIRRRLPFDLTEGQNRAIAEIRADLARTTPMNRLLQADVGAGKTAVAVYAALTTIANRGQVAVLAPTEVLAAQHLAKLSNYLSGSRVGVGYLVGSTPKSRRITMLDELENGKTDLLVGTHALLEKQVRFKNLCLVVIDEQHKFGVAQRAALRQKGSSPHTLVLTATPIPRTLAMTAFGDLDVSTIAGLPPNRRPVVTSLVTPEREQRAWSFVRERLAAGEQAFIVYPLVEESDCFPLKAARVEVEKLSREHLRGYRLGLLHGRMRSADKASVMDGFLSGKTQALVSTTVIEVGVDVPNATIMLVQHAERYGLCQLHQLRGRVGRGRKKSYCLLFSDSAGENSQARLQILCATADGFRIAEEDLRLRGPGEMLGKRQHGIPAFKVADLVTDFDLLEQARDDAAAILGADESMSRPEHLPLRNALIQRYRHLLALIDVA